MTDGLFLQFRDSGQKTVGTDVRSFRELVDRSRDGCFGSGMEHGEQIEGPTLESSTRVAMADGPEPGEVPACLDDRLGRDFSREHHVGGVPELAVVQHRRNPSQHA